MNPQKFALALAIGLGATACSTTTTTEVVSAPLTGPERVCVDSGYTPGSTAYGNCVARERQARRWREEAVFGPAPVGYYAVSTASYAPAVYEAPAQPSPPVGVQAFRDEYGFRYDGQGNRIDARGNIISPQSTQP